MEIEIAEERAWTASFLERRERPTWASEGRRLGVALGLAALYGVALGARGGGASMLVHAAGVPLAIVAVAALGVPAFAIVLALADAPMTSLGLAQAAGRASAKAGLVLAGLAPALALFGITGEDETAGALFAAAGLSAAGLVALRSFGGDLARELSEAINERRRATSFATTSFMLFAAVLAGRVWWVALPALGGAP